ncbi:MAG: tetratricopeptide repeat protein [Gemmatimonadetes bacterium]|nr:tetratricopeptide repeat protein [Gemmatimonadota bacterium]
MPSPSLLLRLKERKLVQWALGYLTGAFVVFQAVEVMAEPWGISPALQRIVHVVLVMGLFITLVLAWYHGEKGHQRVSGGELVLLGVIGVMALGSGWLVRDRAEVGVTQAPWSLPGPPQATEQRIAILPFANHSPAAEADAYLADGLHEEIITQISKISALDVVSRTSVMRFRDPEGRSLPQIAAELGVWYILEGSIRRADDQIRVTAQLIDARTDGHLWAETYDRRHAASAMFEMQSDVAIEIAEALSANLAPAERTRIEKRPTENDEAYDIYLKGLHTYTGSSATAIEGNAYFLQAVELDPEFAEAWAKLSLTYVAMGNFYRAPPSEAFPKAKDAALRALELDGSIAGAHVSLAWVHFTFERDWEAAGTELLRALQLNPGLMDAHYLRAYWLQAMGRFDEAVREGERAVEIDPLNAGTHRATARMLHVTRRFQDAATLFRQSIEMDPAATGAHFYLALSLEQMGRVEEAVTEIQKAALGDGRDSIEVAALEQRYAEEGMAGIWEQWLAWHLDSPTQRPGPIAVSYARLARADEAFEWIERACDLHDSWVFQLNDPLWDPIRRDPRISELRRRLNLPAQP